MIWTITQVMLGAALAYLGFIYIYEFLTTRPRNLSEEGSRAYIYCQQSETEYVYRESWGQWFPEHPKACDFCEDWMEKKIMRGLGRAKNG